MKNHDGMFSLKGKNVFVVGGLGLLGLAVSQTAAANGAKVVVLDVDSDKSKAVLRWAGKHKYRLYYEYFDAADLEACEFSLKRLVKKYGPMHALVNASYPRSRDWARPLEKMTVAYLRENVDKHLNSYLWLGRCAALLMQKAKVKGSIINFGSIYGVVANDLSVYEGTPMSGELTYCAIKGGVVNLTRYLASYFGKDGIRANCICPGGIFDRQNPRFVKNYERKTPLKRMGIPQDVANAAVFLAGDASSYITGEALMVDGGWTAV
ncbi:MAG: SDR family oxidoreductase [Candidatus Omnitrophica bacterium]|nr:SDR family oxidoreductase [Candidatus Omnitrophota bacterium]